jgi:hypothetical protein
METESWLKEYFALRPLSRCKLVGLPAPELNFLDKVSDPRVHRAYHKLLVRLFSS